MTIPLRHGESSEAKMTPELKDEIWTAYYSAALVTFLPRYPLKEAQRRAKISASRKTREAVRRAEKGAEAA